MFSRKKRGLKKAKACIEEQSLKLQNRQINLEEAKTLLALNLEEITLHLPLDLLEDYISTDDWFERRLSNGHEGMVNEVEEVNSILRFAEDYYSDNKFENKEEEEEFLASYSCFRFLSNEFNKDVSDLLISRLVMYLNANFFTNSHLLGNKYHDVFNAFGLSLYAGEHYAQLFLWSFSDWQKLASGVEVNDEFRFLKTPSRIREIKMSSSLDNYKSARQLIEDSIG